MRKQSCASFLGGIDLSADVALQDLLQKYNAYVQPVGTSRFVGTGMEDLSVAERVQRLAADSVSLHCGYGALRFLLGVAVWPPVSEASTACRDGARVRRRPPRKRGRRYQRGEGDHHQQRNPILWIELHAHAKLLEYCRPLFLISHPFPGQKGGNLG